jgi:hypothetical protein
MKKKISLDAGIKHVMTIESLEKLHLLETGLSDNNGMMTISAVTNLARFGWFFCCYTSMIL